MSGAVLTEEQVLKVKAALEENGWRVVEQLPCGGLLIAPAGDTPADARQVKLFAERYMLDTFSGETSRQPLDFMLPAMSVALHRSSEFRDSAIHAHKVRALQLASMRKGTAVHRIRRTIR